MQPVSSDAPAYPDESSAKIPKTPCGTVKRAFRAAFPPHTADSGGLSLPWLRVWSADAHQGLFVPLPDVHGDDNFRRFAGICHRVDAAFSLCAAGDVFDGAADSGAPPVLWAVSAGQYAGTGWKKPLLIFGLCDETFSITCSADVPPEVDHGWFYLWVTVLDWCYWVAGAAVLLHIWRRQMLLSIAGGTIVYMLLVQMM